MMGTNCKRYRFCYGFWKSFGRFWEGLEGIKIRSKKSFFFHINSWDDLPSFGKGLGRQHAAMFAQIAKVFLGGGQFGSRLGVAVVFGTRFGSDLEKV